MINTELISCNLEKQCENLESIECLCFICGKKIKQGIKKNKILSAKFTNSDKAKDKSSKYVCIECATCIKTPDLIRKNFIATKDKIYFLQKNDIEKFVFNLKKIVNGKSFVVCFTKTFKKHNSFKCKVNDDSKIYDIQIEDISFEFNVYKMQKLYNMLNEAYLYFTKDDLITGNYNLLSMQELGVIETSVLEREFKKHRNTHYFNFLIWIMNSETRNDIVKQRIKDKKKVKK